MQTGPLYVKCIIDSIVKAMVKNPLRVLETKSLPTDRAMNKHEQSSAAWKWKTHHALFLSRKLFAVVS